MADTPIATQEEIAAAQAREAAGAAQAAAANAAWRNNTNPVLPVMGSSSGITQAEQADAAREAAKHAAAFHPAEYYGVNPASLGNVPLSQIASRYGTGFADIVQGYYTQNPTAEARAITAQYAATRGGATENPYDPDTAAGIAWLSARQGTPVSASLGQKAVQQGYQGDLFAVSGISTVPTRDYSSGMLTGSKMVAALPGGTTTVYMPYGEYAQIEMKGAKALMDYQTGELGVYQQPYGRSSFMLTGGGGRGALQSGMFTVEKAETPYVVSQEGVGKYILPSGAGLSRLGAEAYYGIVSPLDSRTLEPNEAISRYAGTTGKYNLANFVQQIPAGKAEAPGAKIPWSVEPSTPELSYMDDRGIIAGSAIALPGESGRLVGSKVVAGSPTYGTTDAGIEPSSTLPRPFISTSEASKETQFERFQIAAGGGYSGGLIGYALWGTKSPEVIKGYVGSVVDFVTGVATLGQWQPFAEKMQTSTPYGKTYAYGEYTKAGETVGQKFRESTGGYSEAQLETYGRTLEAKPVGVGPWYDPLSDVRERIVFGTGKLVATNPEKIATAYGGGGVMVVGGSVVSGTAEAIGAGTGTAAFAARTALAGGKYILPAVFTGAMGYSVTEGGTASLSKSLVNVGEMLPEAAGAAVGGGSAYLIKGSNLPIGFQTKQEKPTYYFMEDVGIKSGEPAVPSVSQIRQGMVGEPKTLSPEPFVTSMPFSLKTGTEVMDIGYSLSGRKAGAYPAGVVEGLKPPAPLTRGIELNYMEPGLPGVQGVLTGAPKATRPMTPAEAAFGLKLSIEPIGQAVSPKGLETRFGGGTGISGKGLQQIVNPEIAPLVQKTTYGTSIESNIIAETTKARVSPAVQAAEAQRIVPSATTKTFEKPVSLGSKVFEETLFGIVESEKRTTSMKGKLPRGMQIDYLRDAMKTRAPITLKGKSTKPKSVAGTVEFGPTRATLESYLSKQKPVQAQRKVKGVITGQLPAQIQLPKQKQVPVQVQPQIQPTVQPPITKQPQKQVQPPVQIQPQVQQPSQKQTPYVVPKLISTPATLQTQQPASYQKQTPYVPPTFPTLPAFTGPSGGGGGKITTGKVTGGGGENPVGGGGGGHWVRGWETDPKTGGGGGGFLWPAGTPGSTPGTRKRRAAFQETFMMGLDLSLRGRRTKAAKSFTTPKKYKRTATAKKKGGKK